MKERGETKEKGEKRKEEKREKEGEEIERRKRRERREREREERERERERKRERESEREGKEMTLINTTKYKTESCQRGLSTVQNNLAIQNHPGLWLVDFACVSAQSTSTGRTYQIHNHKALSYSITHF